LSPIGRLGTVRLVTVIQQVKDAITHIKDCTGDANEWRQGLTPTEMAVLVTTAPIDDAALIGLLTKIRAGHPTLFDPRTGAPVTPRSPLPPADGQGQQGEAATAIKKAEDDLVQQNSYTAQLDLDVITAILKAHATTVEGGEELRKLQQGVEAAVRARTDLDTPAGARDFQRYLIDKLREIGAVVESAHLDDGSKAALAGAWTELYESSKLAPPTTTAPQDPAGPQPGTAAEPALPPYGADHLGAGDPLLDQMLGDGLGGDSAWPATGPEAAAASPQQQAPALPIMPGSPSLGGGWAPPGGGLGSGMPAPVGGPRMDESSGSGWSARPSDGLSLDDLLAQEEPPAESDGLSDDQQPAGGGDTKPSETSEKPEPQASGGPTVVQLPNGDSVTAPNPQIARVIEAAVGGTPIGEAFRQQGMIVPPPGTAVTHPVDPGRLSSGDLGMFTDRQALALNRSQALFDGQIQPVASVSGPSFLGWLHPPGPGATTSSAPSSATAPEIAGPPQPTRPATSAGYSR
jgi:hypothetical protein